MSTGEETFKTEWRTLGEICDLSAGGDVPKDKFSKEKTEEFKVPIFSNGVGNNALYGYTDKAKIKALCYNSGKGNYWILCAFLAKAAGGTVKSVPMGELKKILIPVPPLQKQQQAVEILNHFESICNDITTGLPAEIEARQKQYEYYRDRLLTF